MSAEFCVFANQCDSYSVALKCKLTCGLCTPEGVVTSKTETTTDSAQGEVSNTIVVKKRQADSTTPSTETQNCFDEFNDEICDYLQPQCYNPDIILKCRKKCGYCDKDVPVETTQTPFTYSPGTVPHDTLTPGVVTTTTQEGVTTTTNGLTFSPSTAPCTDTCCDEMSAEFCVFANQCDSYSVALKCKLTCGLCTPEGVVTSKTETTTDSAQGEVSNTIVVRKRQADSTTPSTETQNCFDEFNDEICDYLQPQCYNPDIILKCRKKCGYCDKDVPVETTQIPFTYSPGTVPHVTLTPEVVTTTTNGLTFSPSTAPCTDTCCDEMSAEFCVFANQCDSYSVALKCKLTCGLCTPEGTTSESLVTTQVSSTFSSQPSSVLNMTSMTSKAPTTVCEDNEKDNCIDLLLQCDDQNIAQRCRKTCGICSVGTTQASYQSSDVGTYAIRKKQLVQTEPLSYDDAKSSTTGSWVTTGSSNLTTGLPPTLTCNKMADAQIVVADPVNRICYYQFTQDEKVAEAKARCGRANLHLVHLETEEEELFLNKKLQAAGHADQFWLGLEKISGQWVWVDGLRHTPVTSETYWEGSDDGNFVYNTLKDHWKRATDSMYYNTVCEDNMP
ncbi:uncharacterized protein LOC132547816 [Ylistrum balloti]|uniref:uncharacterized protein LOC132547816 n=1 Tax=Ylistrum balloti TaxID=509963 RepID=UPI002905C67D|nr:uncharacterized protein LOC132547816 [Ylistrum balloti]